MLTPASWLFSALAAFRRALYRVGILPTVRIGIPVVVVGNITAGGSGKTPVVLWVAQYLAAQGWKPGIVSRGYGGRVSTLREAPAAVSGVSDPAMVGVIKST